MPKLQGITPKRVIEILKKFDFQLDHTSGSHFIFYNSKAKKRVVVPYHHKDLPRGTLVSILRESGISRKEFEDLLR